VGRGAAVLATATVALAAGCGLGPGRESEGEATLTVTRDYGSQRLLEATISNPGESETVLGFLDREAEIETRYGGGFVQSIEGLSGTAQEDRNLDWFFFVNGIESDRGAAEAPVGGGDRIWWDRRDWTDALRTPAVVGSWPEPFAEASAADGFPVTVECRGPRGPCEEVAGRLGEEGVDAVISEPDTETGEQADAPRILVGPWKSVRDDPIAALLERAPSSSGVFARFERFRGGYRLLALDERAELVREDDSGAGLVAALREGEKPPTWLITGTDASGVELASQALGPSLADRYALFVSAEVDLPLPVAEATE